MFKKIAIALLALLVIPQMLVSNKTVSNAIHRWMNRAATGQSAYAFSPREINGKLEKIVATLPAIETLLIRGRYQEARELFDTTFYALRRSQHEVGNVSLDSTRKLGAELDKLEGQIGTAARREFDRRMAEISQGGHDTATMQRLVRSFPQLGGQDLQKEFTSRQTELDKSRRLAAVRWIRIQVDATADDYEQLITEHLTKVVPKMPGFEVVYGPPVGPLENAATFATINLKIAPELESYVKIQKGESPDWKNNFFRDKSHYGLLAGLHVTLSLSPDAGEYFASFAGLRDLSGKTMNVDVTIPTPEQFELPSNQDPREVFKERNVDRVIQVKARLQTALLTQLPVFKSAPDPAHLTPLSKEQALWNQAAFVNAATAAIATNEHRSSISQTACKLMIEPLGDTVEAQLTKFSEADQIALLKVLASRPWYHGYGPLLKMLIAGPPKNGGGVIEALKNDLDQAAVWQTVFERVRPKNKSPDSLTMILALASVCPASRLEELTTLYDLFPPVDQLLILTSFMERDRDVAAQFARELVRAGKTPRLDLTTRAIADGLSSINSGRVMDLTPVEISFFLEAALAVKGSQKVDLLNALPPSEVLLEKLRHENRANWTPAENLALLLRYESLSPFNPALEATAAAEIFALEKQGGLNTPILSGRANWATGNITNTLWHYDGLEEIKVPLILQIIDDRSPQFAEARSTSLVQLLAHLRAPALLAMPEARAVLTKGRAHPDGRVLQETLILIQQAAALDPAYKDLW